MGPTHACRRRRGTRRKPASASLPAAAGPSWRGRAGNARGGGRKQASICANVRRSYGDRCASPARSFRSRRRKTAACDMVAGPWAAMNSTTMSRWALPGALNGRRRAVPLRTTLAALLPDFPQPSTRFGFNGEARPEPEGLHGDAEARNSICDEGDRHDRRAVCWNSSFTTWIEWRTGGSPRAARTRPQVLQGVRPYKASLPFSLASRR